MALTDPFHCWPAPAPLGDTKGSQNGDILDIIDSFDKNKRPF